ncbi:uncharacterized protein ACLA_090600 [Aspergillus clavatus NRRL 1]|uniref:Uncharacterized protein n=1 Tax=Aspergillus clavatus (strain ATCC 1007 / CBS 513.65 / DSM 816 / NCTC 3887 / NRRL 1 / QM 1276 / 107) TaxID=344612 RepID=A1CER8_ASPCL|nr:uncharacterized protein ACLA_090600 [Aspergillus clavatus NRRL 1]EAW11367.1 conserved hypothetical protein [Aspergillus clavatus NRRL 1]
MPHKVNDSNSTLASSASSTSGDRVVVADLRGSNSVPRRTQPAVIIHNQGGQIYDETRPSDWDKQRWK